MTNEKKLKDLMARMVSMSPPPPENPEEIEMAQPSNQRRRNPAVIFAVTAAAVLVLALPLFLWNGGDGAPVGEGTTTVPPGTTTPSTTGPGIVESIEYPVFLVQRPLGSPSGNPAIVPVWLSLGDPDGLTEDVQRLAGSHVGMLLNYVALGGTVPQGMESHVPEGVQLLGSTTIGSLVSLDMNEAFLHGAGGLLADITMLNQLVYTATIDDPAARVLFTVSGSSVEAFGTEGMSLLEPISREDFLDHLNMILVTRPVEGVDGHVRVVGKANVFEAVVSYRVIGTDIEGFANATCGTGCWGDFEFSIPTSGLGGLVIEIYSASAEDGSPMFLISVPVG